MSSCLLLHGYITYKVLEMAVCGWDPITSLQPLPLVLLHALKETLDVPLGHNLKKKLHDAHKNGAVGVVLKCTRPLQYLFVFCKIVEKVREF